MRNGAATFSSSISTNLSEYDDFPDRHWWHIWELIATSSTDSYRDTDGEEYDYYRDALDWDYSGLRDPNAVARFQAAATYYLTCSDDSSEGEYDPTRECFIVVLPEGKDEGGGAGDNEVRNTVAVTPPMGAPPPDAARATQLAQLRELEVKLNQEREQLLRLKATLKRERAGPSTQGAHVAGRVARERINADADVDEEPVMMRASHKLVMAATMIQAMPEPSTPEGRNLRREAQNLMEQVAMQQAESSASRMRHPSAVKTGGDEHGPQASVHTPHRAPTVNEGNQRTPPRTGSRTRAARWTTAMPATS
jgi:hypothetical protein